ncbi:MAG: Fe(3+) ABC transporter substrate-binding protein [Granulosicoccus sp.]
MNYSLFRPNSIIFRISALALFLGFSNTSVAANEVNVYSLRQPFLTDPIFDAFTKETGIKVNTVFAKEGLIERLQNEGRNSPADLLIAADIGRLSAAVDAGVAQAVKSDVLQKNIPEAYRDPADQWFGLTNRARLIVTAKGRVEPGLFESYEDLAKPELKGRLCTRSGKHEYMVALIASVIVHEGLDSARSWLNGLKENLARKPQGNDRAQVKAVAEGQCDIAIINSYYLGAMAQDAEQKPWFDAVNIVFPNQQGRGTHMNISGILMTKAAPHRDNALKLMEYLTSDEAQRLYADGNNEYPVRADIEPSDLVASWGTFKADTLPLADIAKQRANATRLVDEVDYDG